MIHELLTDGHETFVACEIDKSGRKVDSMGLYYRRCDDSCQHPKRLALGRILWHDELDGDEYWEK